MTFRLNKLVHFTHERLWLGSCPTCFTKKLRRQPFDWWSAVIDASSSFVFFFIPAHVFFQFSQVVPIRSHTGKRGSLWTTYTVPVQTAGTWFLVRCKGSYTDAMGKDLSIRESNPKIRGRVTQCISFHCRNIITGCNIMVGNLNTKLGSPWWCIKFCGQVV